jgi:predicted ATPase with chaperone activity
MVGPPSAGKSMLAARLPSILPPLAPSELLEVLILPPPAGKSPRASRLPATPDRALRGDRTVAYPQQRRRVGRHARRRGAARRRRPYPIARSGRCDAALGYHRVLRVDRTLADLEVGRVHVVEALSYRALTDEIRRAA